jgi:hypothetical protein
MALRAVPAAARFTRGPVSRRTGRRVLRRHDRRGTEADR